MKLLALLATGTATALGLTAAQVSAATVDSDNFETTDHPTGDRTVVSGGINGLPFYSRTAVGGSFTPSIVNDSGAGGLGSLVLTSNDTANNSGDSKPLIGLLPVPITLGAQGDFITLSFSFRFINGSTASAANAAGFRFGLFDSNGTAVTGDNQTVSDNDNGYYVQTGVGGTAPVATNVFWREAGDGLTTVLAGTDRANLAASGAGAAFNDTTGHTASFTVTRGSGTNMSFSLSYDGGTAITASSTTSPLYSFDEVAFADGFVGTSLRYNIDNILITSNVPEPGSAVMLLGGLGMLALRRRRRA